jgi:hypothetical protein
MTIKNVPAKVRVNNVDTIVELNETETLTNKTLTAPTVNAGSISQAVLSMPVEQFTYSYETADLPGTASALGVQTIDVTSATAYYFNPTTGKSVTWVPTFTNVGTLLNEDGKSVTVTVIAKIASSGGFAATIGLTGSTLIWQGGVTPGSGNTSSGTDAYTYTIVRTAADTYTVFASRTRFA